jgi:hypothetical protein
MGFNSAFKGLIKNRQKKNQHEDLKQQQCFKHACGTQEQHLHSFQQVSHEKSFDMKVETRRRISLVSTNARC